MANWVRSWANWSPPTGELVLVYSTSSESGGWHSAVSHRVISRFAASSPEPSRVVPVGAGHEFGSAAKATGTTAEVVSVFDELDTTSEHALSWSHVKPWSYVPVETGK